MSEAATTDKTEQGSKQESTQQSEQQTPEAAGAKTEESSSSDDGHQSLLSKKGTGESSEDGAAGGGSKDQDGAGADQGAPETYQFEAPEGAELDEESVKLAEPVFRDLGLSNEQAQKVVNLLPEVQDRIVKAAAQQWVEQRQAQRTESQKDKVLIGEDGQSLDANLDRIRSGIDRYGKQYGQQEADDLTAFLEESGGADRAVVLRFLLRYAEGVGEDSIAGTSGGGEGGSASNELDPVSLYPTMQKQ